MGSRSALQITKRYTRLAVACDKVFQLLIHVRWYSPSILDSSTTKTGRHDIAEILLKVALKHQKSNQIIHGEITVNVDDKAINPNWCRPHVTSLATCFLK